MNVAGDRLKGDDSRILLRMNVPSNGNIPRRPLYAFAVDFLVGVGNLELRVECCTMAKRESGEGKWYAIRSVRGFGLASPQP